MDRLDNPFITDGIPPKAFFCDRSADLQKLKGDVDNGRNTVLNSQPGMGKTSLIHRLFAQPEMQSNYFCFYVSAYGTTSLQDLAGSMYRSIYDQCRQLGQSGPQDFLIAITSVRRIAETNKDHNDSTQRPVVIHDADYTIEQIFRFLNRLDKPCILALDDFHLIASYKDAPAEAVLRTHVQSAPNVRMIFSGCSGLTLAQMFLSPSRPFYASTEFLQLRPIHEAVYRQFAQKLFCDYDRHLPEACFETIYRQADGCTAKIQQSLHRLFALTRTGETADFDDTNDIISFTAVE